MIADWWKSFVLIKSMISIFATEEVDQYLFGKECGREEIFWNLWIVKVGLVF